MPEPVNVNIIAIHDDERNKRLRYLWDAFAAWRSDIRLHWFDNLKRLFDHDVALNLLWKAERRRPERYAIITEADFLPDYDAFPDLGCLDRTHPIAASEYATRALPDDWTVSFHGCPGAWYVAVDKSRIGALNFTCGGIFNDPANDLAAMVRQVYGPECAVRLIPQVDDYPNSTGLRMKAGLHLFWSRALGYPPDSGAFGVDLSHVLELHDKAVQAWISNAPQGLKDHL